MKFQFLKKMGGEKTDAQEDRRSFIHALVAALATSASAMFLAKDARADPSGCPHSYSECSVPPCEPQPGQCLTNQGMWCCDGSTFSSIMKLWEGPGSGCCTSPNNYLGLCYVNGTGC